MVAIPLDKINYSKVSKNDNVLIVKKFYPKTKNVSYYLKCACREQLFSAPEPKAQVHYCDHALSVVRPSVVRPSLTFHIFDFSSETTEQNSTKLDRMQVLNILYQVCVF